MSAGLPTPEASDFYARAEKVMAYLANRWLDEREYENIEDYRKVLMPIAKQSGVVITKMLKRPFGCEFTVAGKLFKLTRSTRLYGYQQIG